MSSSQRLRVARRNDAEAASAPSYSIPAVVSRKAPRDRETVSHLKGGLLAKPLKVSETASQRSQQSGPRAEFELMGFNA